MEGKGRQHYFVFFGVLRTEITTREVYQTSIVFFGISHHGLGVNGYTFFALRWFLPRLLSYQVNGRGVWVFRGVGLDGV